MDKMTAAHRTLPFETWVRVLNLDNNKTVEVRIQDRGPFVDGRIIDLSRAAAKQIDMIGPGTARVKLTVIAPPRNIERQVEAFAVQVGAFRDRARAEAVRESMEQRYGDARTVERQADPPVYRVLVGHLEDQVSATQMAERMRRDGEKDCFVVRLDSERE